MIRLLFLRLWPVFLPLIVYILWIHHCRRRASRTGAPVPTFRDGPWVWAVVASLAIAIAGFVLLGVSHRANDGIYIPAHMESGRLVPARTVPAETAPTDAATD